MSAITGIFYRNGRKVGLELIKKMNDRLSHRGPDGSAVWCEGNVALGHQMLWTTPESLHEKLPFHDKKAGLVITADARIDNRKELSEELDIEDNEHVSDSYFILKAYEKWGEKCPEYLLGDFAFAIWDENEEKLLCARDHMGVKPFYYYLDDEIFCFATEIKALFSLPDILYDFNEKKIAFFLLYVTSDKELTFYENIFSLTSANKLNVTKFSFKKKVYWKLDPNSKIIMESFEDYFKNFRKIFRESVKCRLRSAFPLGFELSGGLDSSSVVCMSKNILNNNQNINTYSYVYCNFPQSDESYYIKKVIDSGGINPHYIHGDKISPFKKIDEILYHHEQPFSTPYLSIMWSAYEKMYHNNTRVNLTGYGGDAVVFRGYNYLSELAVTFKWSKFFKELYFTSKNRNKNIYKNFKLDFIFPLIPENLKKRVRPYLGNNDIGIPRHLSFLNNKFSNILNIDEYPSNIRRKNIEPYDSKSYHYYLLNTVSIQSTLEMIDKVSSAFKIESRHPFLDKRLIEFCFAIPSDINYRLGWDRYIERNSMTMLPNEIRWRPQKAFLDDMLKHNLLLFEKNRLEYLFSNKNEHILKYVDLNQLKSVYADYCNGNLDNNEDVWFLWSVLLLDMWLKKIHFNP